MGDFSAGTRKERTYNLPRANYAREGHNLEHAIQKTDFVRPSLLKVTIHFGSSETYS